MHGLKRNLPACAGYFGIAQGGWTWGGGPSRALPPIFGTAKTSAFSKKMQNQGLRQLFSLVSWDL